MGMCKNCPYCKKEVVIGYRWRDKEYYISKRRRKNMSDVNIENMQKALWGKKPFPTTEYILCEILKELRELNETLINLKQG